MRSDVLQRLGLGAKKAVQENPTFPYKTGNLLFNATKVSFLGEDTFKIEFDETIAPYIKYLENEEGLYRSTKHQFFISQRATDDVINYLMSVFNVSAGFVVRQGKQTKFGSTGIYRPKGKDPLGE